MRIARSNDDLICPGIITDTRFRARNRDCGDKLVPTPSRYGDALASGRARIEKVGAVNVSSDNFGCGSTIIALADALVALNIEAGDEASAAERKLREAG